MPVCCGALCRPRAVIMVGLLIASSVHPTTLPRDVFCWPSYGRPSYANRMPLMTQLGPTLVAAISQVATSAVPLPQVGIPTGSGLRVNRCVTETISQIRYAACVLVWLSRTASQPSVPY